MKKTVHLPRVRKLKKVPRLGPKAYEQAIGFLRIPGAKNVLDTTAIHPESYNSAKEILDLAEVDLKLLGSVEATKKIQSITVKSIAAKA